MSFASLPTSPLYLSGKFHEEHFGIDVEAGSSVSGNRQRRNLETFTVETVHQAHKRETIENQEE